MIGWHFHITAKNGTQLAGYFLECKDLLGLGQPQASLAKPVKSCEFTPIPLQ